MTPKLCTNRKNVLFANYFAAIFAAEIFQQKKKILSGMKFKKQYCEVHNALTVTKL